MSILASSSLSSHLNTQGYQYNHGRSQSDQTSTRSKTMDESGYISDDTRAKRHREDDKEDADETPSTPKRARTAPSSPVNYSEDEGTSKKRSGMMTPPPSDPVVLAVSPLQENAGTSLSTPMSSPKTPKLPPIRVRPDIRPTVKPVSIIENSSLYFPDTSYSYFSGRTTLPKSFTESNIREAKDDNEEWRETMVHTLRANDGEKFREFRNFCHSAGANANAASAPQPVVDEHFDSRISSKAAHEIPRLAQLIDRRLLRTESSTGRLYNTTNIVNFPFVNNYTYQSHDYLKDLEMLSTTAAQSHQRTNHYYYNVAPSVAPTVPPPPVVCTRTAMPPLATPTVPLSETRHAPQTTYCPPPSPKKKPVNLSTQTRFFTSPKMSHATTKPTSPTTSTRVCISCKSNQSPCWRPSWSVIEGQLCNSCGLRYKKTGARCLNKQCLRIPAKGEWSFMKSKGKTNAALYDENGNKVGATLAYKCLHCDGAVEVEEGR